MSHSFSSTNITLIYKMSICDYVCISNTSVSSSVELACTWFIVTWDEGRDEVQHILTKGDIIIIIIM